MRKFYRPAESSTELNLTSLMDMFTILLFFFLTQYSAEGVVMTLAEGVTLPSSQSKVPLAEKHYIAVTKDKVMVDKEEFSVTGSDDAVIMTRLEEIHKKGFDYLVVQADKDLPFYLIRNYIRLAVQAGFSKPFLAVTPK